MTDPQNAWQIILDQEKQIKELQDSSELLKSENQKLNETVTEFDQHRLRKNEGEYFPSMDDRENWTDDERVIFHALSFTIHGDCDPTTLEMAMTAHRRAMWLKYGILTLTRDYGRTAPFTDFN